jgi:transcriptional regulator with XRE-family HTH domain
MASTQNTQDDNRGKRITELIRLTDLLDYQVADAIGTSTGQLSKIKRGGGFSLTVLKALTLTLHTTSDYILFGAEPLPGFNRLNEKEKLAVLSLIQNLA